MSENKPKKVYINYEYMGQRETIDEFDDKRTADAMLSEYQMAFNGGRVWVSSRPCANWG